MKPDLKWLTEPDYHAIQEAIWDKRITKEDAGFLSDYLSEGVGHSPPTADERARAEAIVAKILRIRDDTSTTV